MRNIERNIKGETKELREFFDNGESEGYTPNAVALSRSDVLELSISRFQDVMQDVVEAMMHERFNAMRKNELLGQLSDNCLFELAFKVEVEERHFGEFIIKQKEVQYFCYIVLKGECQVVYANVLDTPSIRDFKKYKQGPPSKHNMRESLA